MSTKRADGSSWPLARRGRMLSARMPEPQREPTREEEPEGEGRQARTPVLLFLPGNGHSPARLAAAREALRRVAEAEGRAPFELRELAYPKVARFEELLDALEAQLARAPADAVVYATGIGALVALALRARGALLRQRLILQGGVLWGLERRRFPRLMRLPGMTRLLTLALRSRLVQRRFARKHFRAAHPPALLEAFFAGYRDAGAFAAWFEWLRPELLRRLERELRAHPERLERIAVWWGEQDGVVPVEELRLTEAALGRRFQLRVVPRWGHYPMIDEPERWVEELRRALAPASSLP